MSNQKEKILDELDIIQNRLIKDGDLMMEVRKILLAILDKKEPPFIKGIEEDIYAIDSIIERIDRYYTTLEKNWGKYFIEDISYKY